jgi:adenosylcobinamide kinase/adenosylcobinamide-phosphate guanylyltransferase
LAGRIILISGPVRSGKSDYAENMAARLSSEQAEGHQTVAYIATAQPFDSEMEERIKLHQSRRPSTWQTYEAPFEPWEAIRSGYEDGHRVFLLDCLTMLSTNWLCRQFPDPDTYQLIAEKEQQEILDMLDRLTQAVAERDDLILIIVTNEVGWGLVPDYALGRLYRDLSGRCNRQMAAAASQAWLVVMGLPLQLK